MKNIETKVVQLLAKKNQMVSIAESCTGGRISDRLTSVPGASQVFGYGVISYSADAKQKILRVGPKLIQKYGQVSEAVAVAMAKGIQRLSKSTYAISVTGIAGPTGGTSTKPVGTVCFSLIYKSGQNIKRGTLHLKGSRNKIRNEAATKVLMMLYQFLR